MSRLSQFPEKHCRALVAVLLLINLALATTSILNKSLTYDEPAYMGAGKYIVETGDTSAVVAASPPLPYFVNGILWYFVKFDPSSWRNFRQFHVEDRQSLPIIFESAHDPDRLIFLARLPIILTFPLLGLLIFGWARELYGPKVGLFALTLAVFSPNLIAHERLATTDFLTVLTIFGAVYCFRRFLSRQTGAWVFFAGVTLGLALLTRFTALILLPSYLILMFLLPRDDFEAERSVTRPAEYLRTSKLFEIRRGRRRVAHALWLLPATAFLVVWAGYFFELRPPYVPSFAVVPSEQYFSGIMEFFYEKGVRLPAVSFLISLYHQVGHGRIGHPNFFMGMTSWAGHWYYFPFVFLIKTPVPTLLFLCIALIFFRKSAGRYKHEQMFLIVPAGLLTIASLCSNINIGLRHILPILPFLFVWVSRIVTFDFSLKRARLYSWLIAILLVWYVGSNIYIYPHYLEYFNELIGGPKNGYKYVVDSNLDWGQDLKLLIKYMNEKNIRPERIVYFGPPSLLHYYGYMNAAGDCSEPEEGYLAISATFLHSLYLSPNCYDWLKRYEPAGRIAYSMFIYKITPPPGDRTPSDASKD